MPLTDVMSIFRLPWFRALLAFGAGVSTLFAFAPFSLYPLAVAGPLLLFLLWLDASPRRAFREGWFFGLGLLGFGVSWLHISIDEFGNVGTPLAILITSVFIVLLSLYYGLVGWLGRVLMARGLRRWEGLLLFASLWVLSEWLRGWLFTGFPWLSLGYSQIDSPLAGWATVFGVYGVSWAVV
ncbi:MAG: apolipoprotein N-acyltransferase, partial [Planctomycetes bacterium]|nr:apolipoprotein N-acyltransferase [Planctomycetota bacterium]